MGPIYRSLAAYEPLIYIALAIWSLFVFRSMYRSWREWQDSVYSLEREFALTRLVRATAIALMVLGLVFAEFFKCSSLFLNIQHKVQRQVSFTRRETYPEPINFPSGVGAFVSFIAKTDD